MLRYLTLILLGLLGLQSLQAQSEPRQFCGTQDKSPWLEWYQSQRDALVTDRGNDTTLLFVPITIHIVGTNSGIGYYPADQAFRILCTMNEQFSEAYIYFYLHPEDPFVYHPNSVWYEHDWDGGAEMILTTKLPNRVNAYIVSDPAGNCGYAWYDAIVMAKSCSGPNNGTWAHEAGHHLSLPHPFFGWEGTQWNYSQPAPEFVNGWLVEKTDGSNCYDAGDGFCDTRPDYLNYRWSCNGNQESQQVQKDPNGVTFRSDASLIMGYALDACQSRFTPEQIEAMRANLQTEHIGYLQTFDLGPQINDDDKVQLLSPIDSQQAQYNQAKLEWAPVENARFYHVQVALSPSFPFQLYNAVVEGTSTTVTKGIPNNRVLYWRVRAYSDWDPCQPFAGEQIGVFKTKNLTATNELERNISVLLAPNPVSEGLPARLTINASERMDAMLTVHDAAGRQVSSQNARILSGENTFELDTEGLRAGFYLVTIRNEQGAIVERLVVSN